MHCVNKQADIVVQWSLCIMSINKQTLWYNEHCAICQWTSRHCGTMITVHYVNKQADIVVQWSLCNMSMNKQTLWYNDHCALCQWTSRHCGSMITVHYVNKQADIVVQWSLCIMSINKQTLLYNDHCVKKTEQFTEPLVGSNFISSLGTLSTTLIKLKNKHSRLNLTWTR